MTAISEMRRSMAATLAARLLSDSGVNALPVDLALICMQNGWALKPYSEVATDIGRSVNDVCLALQTDNGVAYDDGHGTYVIAYNDNHPIGRQRFTIAHEMGHIILKHISLLKASMVSKTTMLKDNMTYDQYSAVEQEADDFARNLLSPPTIMRLRTFNSLKHIAHYFHVSKSCAYYRDKELHDDLMRIQAGGHYQVQIDQFADYTMHNPYGTKTSNQCLNQDCGVYLIGQDTKCPVCGHNTTVIIDAIIQSKKSRKQLILDSMRQDGVIFVGKKMAYLNQVENAMVVNIDALMI